MQVTQPGGAAAAAHASAVAAGRAFGAMLFTVFGTVLLEVWDRRAGVGMPAFIGIALLGIALLAMAFGIYRSHAPALKQESQTPERKRADRVFHSVNAGQWVLILVLGNVMANTGLGDWVIPMAIFVIGLHFVPLAYVFRNTPHYITGAALMGFALLYPRLAAGGPTDPVGFLGIGMVLWASAAWALRSRKA